MNVTTDVDTSEVEISFEGTRYRLSQTETVGCLLLEAELQTGMFETARFTVNESREIIEELWASPYCADWRAGRRPRMLDQVIIQGALVIRDAAAEVASAQNL